MTAFDTEVLIIGAGPTGLTLALWLKRLGVAVRIIDKSDGPGRTSRALAVQARILEFHRQVGIVDDVLAEGVRLNQLSVRTSAGLAAELKLSDFGKERTPYPFAFALPQDVHERVLAEELQRLGLVVERSTELAGFQQDKDGVTVRLVRNGTMEVVRAAYLAGCDGARSPVRHGLNLDFPGGTYDQSFYVVDVDGTGDVTRNGMDVKVNTYGFALIMPVRQSGSLRLIGVVPQTYEKDETITFEAIRADIERDTGISIKSVNWFSTYRVHHRVADHFRSGRVFIAGDAGHIHSPAGGQGMNTGMGDAVNLGWKLAAVLQGRADEKLLDSYEPERITFAHKLVASTDQAFRLVTGRSKILGFWRRYLMPTVMSTVLSTGWGSRFFFGLISQTGISYRKSPMSVGQAGKLSGGDRLPYVKTASSDNFAPLVSLDWQLHVYGEVDPAFRLALAATGIPLHVYAWSETAAAAGLVRNGVYLVRPDGHIALASPKQDARPFESYVRDLAIRPRGSAKREHGADHLNAMLADRMSRLRYQLQSHSELGEER